ncbi:hypothetical protein [Desulfosporosinus sp. FKA]|uniref:hypothetical protein n=1 Tax=Desulfosporosinus sp. FKA TaxID=1969834 RepID=UPI001557C1E1|nr:hypothetical protein [Desulfosporosinus sp. FKA]
MIMGPKVVLVGGVAAIGVIAAVLLNRSGNILFHSTAQHASFYEYLLMQKMLMDEYFTTEFIEQHEGLSYLAEDWPQDEYVLFYESSPIKEIVDVEACKSWNIPLDEVHRLERSSEL